jgi:predicted MFS family arabinose efflux permease
VFLLNVPVSAVALAAGAVLVPNSRDPKPGAFDFPGVALSVGTLGALVYAIIEAPNKGWTDPVIIACFVASAVLAAAFVRWELRTPAPMLNLDFFRNPRFSVASGGIGIASFALFGGIFGMTQFLQDAHGFSALQAGAAMTPLALGLVMGAGGSTKIVPRLGTTRLVSAGLALMGTLLSLSLFWSADMPYWPLAFWFWGLAVSMGWVMAPSTDSVMGAVPPEKSGVASAMNDVTRQVGGALGTAIIGSLISSFYASRIGDDVASLPEPARSAAKDSIGQANAVAASLPHDQGASLTSAAADAFTTALGIGFTAAAIVAILGAFAVRRWLPARHRDIPTSDPAPRAA